MMYVLVNIVWSERGVNARLRMSSAAHLFISNKHATRAMTIDRSYQLLSPLLIVMKIVKI